MGCKECPIYRGRHCFIKAPHATLPRSASAPGDEAEWMKGFNEFFDDMNQSFRESIKALGFEEPEEPKK